MSPDPTGSSSVERAFSLLARIISKDVSTISNKFINSKLCIQLNGRPVKQTDIRYYTEEWVKNNLRADDPLWAFPKDDPPYYPAETDCDDEENNPHVMFGCTSYVK